MANILRESTLRVRRLQLSGSGSRSVYITRLVYQRREWSTHASKKKRRCESMFKE